MISSLTVYVFVLLASATAAMILDDQPTPPVASSGTAGSPAPGGPPAETLYQDGQQSGNIYSYPTGKQYSSYTYVGSPSSQYGSAAADGGNSANGYSASSSYQNGAPQYVSSFRGFSNMAIAQPYTYYIAHPGEVPSGASYQGARNEADEGLQPESDASHTDDSQNVNPVKAANRAFNPAHAINGSGKRSLLEMITPQESLPPTSSLSSASFLDNARVQLSFTGGYPTNSPRYTYLTFIIPGDLCTLNPQDVLGSTTQLQTGLKLGSQMAGFTTHLPYGSTYSSFSAPALSAAGYGTSGQYQYAGSAVRNQAMYSNGQTLFGALPGVSQTYGLGATVNGGVVGGPMASGVAGSTFLTPALRSLDDPNENAEDSKPPSSPSAPATGDAKPNEAPSFPSASRSISK